VCILCGDVEVRQHRPTSKQLNKDIDEAMSFLGVTSITKGSFPNIALNTVAHFDLVRFIENAIKDTGAKVVFTHHPTDLNNDHYHVSIACQAATMLFQRRTDIIPIQELLFMEISSSTEWSLNTSTRQFTPNTYVEIGKGF